MPKRRFSDIAVALALGAALAGCGQDAAGPRDTAAAVPVTTTGLALRPWSDTIRALGTVKARESVTVTAKVSETVQTVHFESGDDVAEGDPLVTLTGNQQRATLAQAEAAANEAERLYKRLSELGSQQLIARSALDTQRA